MTHAPSVPAGPLTCPSLIWGWGSPACHLDQEKQSRAWEGGQGGSAPVRPALGRGRRTTWPWRCCPFPPHSFSGRRGGAVDDDQGGDISPSTQGPGPRGQEQSNPRETWDAAAEMGSVSRQAGANE